MINYNWQPNARVVSAISAMGMQEYTVKTDFRREFILYCQQQELRNQHGDWDQLFLDYAKQRLQVPAAKATTAAPAKQALQPYTPDAVVESSNIMSDDWQPSANMLEYITAMVCPNLDYINAQLISFTSHYHGKSHPNWDQQFKKWINQGWNVYQNKNSFKDASNKDFVKQHTDTSWSDGL
ncbi:DnaT-like ssDNA-binding domain-containing protein [Dasania marina]|uniref:DnaT-like ssDNA-binding domain-containing protein n=1 Tax=Dasania marina TaxID=471499 RepID=UPI0030D81018|tara:strand:+ start:82051 stop:82593 length:543 start_codon:yes stop_codon:yes gene_type:complete